jgi:hypothetical protein
VRIVINHLTRMRALRVCTAGIDVETQRHIRPVLAGSGQLTNSLLHDRGGPFHIGVELELGPTTAVPRRPEIEDHIFQPAPTKAVRTLSDTEFWSLLNAVSSRRLKEVFGDDLSQMGATSCGVSEGCGAASLGCLIPAKRPGLSLRTRPGKPAQVRIWVTDGDFHLDLSVTDVRLYQTDLATPADQVVQDLNRRMRRGVRVILSVGLTRPFATSPEQTPVHWLQVNNIHLEDRPIWGHAASVASQ